MYDESHIGNDVYSTEYPCPHCGSYETDYDGYCVHCGELVVEYEPAPKQPVKATRKSSKAEKTKKKKHVGLGITLLVLGFIIFACAVGGGSSSSSTPSSSNTSVAKTDNETKSNTETRSKDSEPSIEYVAYTADDMMADLDSNPLNASSKYKNQYAAVTGRLGVIDASGQYIAIYPTDNEFAFVGVQCYTLKKQDVLDVISTLSTGDHITVYGKITDVGEVLGYSMNIDRIEK